MGVMINETNLKNLIFAVCIVMINSWNFNFVHYLNITFLKWNTVQWHFCLPSQGEFSTIIELPEGEHEYKFCVDGRWIHDPNAVSTILIYKQKLLDMSCHHARVYSSQSIFGILALKMWIHQTSSADPCTTWHGNKPVFCDVKYCCFFPWCCFIMSSPWWFHIASYFHQTLAMLTIDVKAKKDWLKVKIIFLLSVIFCT